MFGKFAIAPVCGRFQVIAKDLLCGAWLAGDFREAEKKWLGQPAAGYGEDADGLVFRGALQNHSVQVLDPPRDLRLPSQDFFQFFNFLLNRRRSIEIHWLVRLLALCALGVSYRA